ncbi:MAG: 3'-5' exonuclease [Desulfobulbales bacterium]
MDFANQLDFRRFQAGSAVQQGRNCVVSCESTHRTGRQAGVIADSLISHGFPVQVVDVVPYYLAGPARPMYLWILLAAGLAESSHLLTLMRKKKGAGKTLLAEAEHVLAGTIRQPMSFLLQNKARCSIRMQSVLTEMKSIMEMVRKTVQIDGLVAALHQLLPICQIDENEEDIVRLLTLADNFGSSLDKFAQHLQRYSDSVVYDDRAEAITLMTLHASKGLEFKVVFITGIEEGLAPLFQRSPLSPGEEINHSEEERRLFYVGMTRAEETLYLSYTLKRNINGRLSGQKPSRFIREIPPELISPFEDQVLTGTRKRRAKQLSLFE